MSRGPVVQVTGARELRSAMRRAGADLNDLKSVNADVAGIASQAGRAAAPERSGLLASSVRAGATRTQAIVRAGGARIPYAGPIHWGWAARHIAPHPFLVDAAHRTEPAWTSVYAAAVESIIERIERTTPS